MCDLLPPVPQPQEVVGPDTELYRFLKHMALEGYYSGFRNELGAAWVPDLVAVNADDLVSEFLVVDRQSTVSTIITRRKQAAS